MLHKILDNKLEMLERPPAAFLLPFEHSEANLLHISDGLWQTYKELLPEGYGRILQNKISEPDHTATDSLIFDAREQEDNRYLWQLTHVADSKRSIFQLVVEESGVRQPSLIGNQNTQKYSLRGYIYEADTQGRVNKVTDIPEGQPETTIFYSLWQRGLANVIRSQDFRTHVQEIRDRKRAAQGELSRFISERTITKTLPKLEVIDGIAVKSGERVVKDFEVTRDRYEQIHTELKERVKRTGFVVVSPYKNIPARQQLNK